MLENKYKLYDRPAFHWQKMQFVFKKISFGRFWFDSIEIN